MRIALAVARFTMAAVILAVVAISAFDSIGGDAVTIADFASYLATSVGGWAVIALVLSGVRLLTRAPPSVLVDRIRFFAVTYTVVLVLCRGVFRAPWDPTRGYPITALNVVLVVGVCVFMLIDWLAVRDHDHTPRRALWWLPVFPIVWSTVIVIRGVDMGWTPYPLLDPSSDPGRLITTLIVVWMGALATGAALIGAEAIIRTGRVGSEAGAGSAAVPTRPVNGGPAGSDESAAFDGANPFT